MKIWKGENKQNSLSTPLTLSHLLVLFFGSMVGMYVPMNELKECVFLSINISASISASIIYATQLEKYYHSFADTGKK